MERLWNWWTARRKRQQELDKALAAMVALTSTMPGVPPPSKAVRKFVNRQLRRPFFSLLNDEND